MRRLKIFVHDDFAGELVEHDSGNHVFTYAADYEGAPVSLTMPPRHEPYVFEQFPPFFDGVLPEGLMLESLLRQRKLDRGDFLGQLSAVGADLVGAVTAGAIIEGDE